MADPTPVPPVPRRRPVGRPLKLTDEIARVLVLLVRAGNFRSVAARKLHIHPDTLGTWMAKGKAQHQGRYYEFRRALIEAETDAEVAMVATVALAAKADARHAEWWLERKFPHRWGRRQMDIGNARGEDGAVAAFSVTWTGANPGTFPDPPAPPAGVLEAALNGHGPNGDGAGDADDEDGYA